MKYQHLISAARPARAARLPAALALLLLACLVLQLALPGDSELPPTLAIGRAGGSVAAPPVEIAGPAGVLLDRPLFAPRLGARTGPGAEPSALGGAVVAGTVAIRGAARAVVRRADGSIGYLPVGGAIAGWRLVRLDTDRAWFQKAAQRLSVPYGAAAPAATPAEAEEDEEEEEEQ